tara:strand:- start:196 stop:441 length:246 start_codon:yes stop_codon:yes gene_type:complete
MPKVGNKKAGGMKFPNKKNMNEAFNYAKQTGRALEIEGSYKHGGKVMPKYNLGGLVRNALAKRNLMNSLASMYKKGGKVKK